MVTAETPLPPPMRTCACSEDRSAPHRSTRSCIWRRSVSRLLRSRSLHMDGTTSLGPCCFLNMSATNSTSLADGGHSPSCSFVPGANVTCFLLRFLSGVSELDALAAETLAPFVAEALAPPAWPLTAPHLRFPEPAICAAGTAASPGTLVVLLECGMSSTEKRSEGNHRSSSAGNCIFEGNCRTRRSCELDAFFLIKGGIRDRAREAQGLWGRGYP
jgi:hypothetical protein